MPDPEFEAFADCPAYVKGLESCIVATTTGGSFTIGNKTVPINKPIVLQGVGFPDELDRRLQTP